MTSTCPLWLPQAEHLLKITPLSDPTWQAMSGNNGPLFLLEWLPRPGDDKFEMLQEISQVINSSLILEDIFEALGDVLSHYVPYYEATIVILDDSQNSIKSLVRMQADEYLEISGESTFSGYDPIVDVMVRNPAPLLFYEANLPDSIVFSTPQAPAPGNGETPHAMAMPLINKGVVIGLIALISPKETGFLPHQRLLLGQVCDQLAIAVENAKLYWQTQAQAGREFLINQITKSIRQSLDIDTILNTAAQELGRVTGVSRCFINYLLNNTFPSSSTTERLSGEPGSEVKITVTPMLEEAKPIYQYLMPGIAPLNEGIPFFEHQVFKLRNQNKEQTFNPFILNDCRDHPPTLENQEFFEQNAIKSLAIFPILVRNTLVGTITLHQCDAYRSWISEDIQLLQAIAEHLGVALYQAQLFLELEQQKLALEITLSELQQTQVQLIQSEKMAVLGQFTAGIAHEVNTPLGTITSNNSTLKHCVQRLDKDLESYLAQIDTTSKLPSLLSSMHDLVDLNKMASDRIHEIVKSLRNFARLDESELKTVDVHEGIDSTLLVMRSSLPPHITIEKRYAENLPEVPCYPGLLNQVFMNLLVNASHAMGDMPAGHITIESSVDTANQQINIRFEDTGAGIPPENLLRIFDPGFTTKRRGLGTGLGLALCYRIIEKHRGKIIAESTVGKGTRFTVTLPISPSSMNSAGRP